MNRQLKRAWAITKHQVSTESYPETYSPNLNGVHNDGNLPTDPLIQLRVDRQYSVNLKMS
jgi:hypothetical protein